MRDWVEFNMNGDTVAVRPSYVVLVETAENGTTKLRIEFGDNYYEQTVTEPYDEVMEKLKKAEEYETLPVVEHFTRDEYAELLATLDFRTKNDAHWPGELMLIKSKLEKILKGEE